MQKRNYTIERFKVFASFLVIMIHTAPFLSFSPTLHVLTTEIFARIAVPFFMMITGYYVLSKSPEKRLQSTLTFTKKILRIYLISVALYLPLILYSGRYQIPSQLLLFLKDLLTGEVFYHLWYLPAMLLGTWIVSGLLKITSVKNILLVTVPLYLFGLLGDSYFGLAQFSNFLTTIFQGYFNLLDFTRNGLFFAPIFITLGVFCHQQRRHKNALPPLNNLLGLSISLILLLIEGWLLYVNEVTRHTSMYLFLVPTMYFLFMLLQQKRSKPYNGSTLSLVIYLIHPWYIFLLFGASKINFLKFLSNEFVQFILVSLFSYLTAIVFQSFFQKKKTDKTPKRAWCEINLANLSRNYHAFAAHCGKDVETWPVIKANAYGHGAEQIATHLQKEGANGFCTATLDEAIALRKAGIKKDILILGYTRADEIGLVKKYHLVQTIADSEHFQDLEATKIPFRAHVKIDTGMHRLGFSATDLSKLEQVFHSPTIRVEGIFTHLGRSDSTAQDDISFSNKQLNDFHSLLNHLASVDISTIHIHSQATYGVINYVDDSVDITRIGGGLYLGIDDTCCFHPYSQQIQPIMEVKATLTAIHNVKKGESVGYGQAFFAPNDMKVATVSIGYADGLPQQWTRNGGTVTINHKYAPIIGKICMDQLMVDITSIEHVNSGQDVLIISSNLHEPNSIMNIARTCDLHQNEIASRLGERLSKVYQY